MSELHPSVDNPYLMCLFSVMIRAQTLSELEEVIQYKQHGDQPERQASMKRTWMKRFVYTSINII